MFIKKHNFDYYLLPKEAPLTTYLLKHNHEPIYDINNVILLRKKTLS